MRKLFFSILVLIFAQSATADLLSQANSDYLGIVKKVKVIQEVSSSNLLYKYVHLRAYTDESSDSAYLETIYLIDITDEVISKITSSGEVSHVGYISNYLGEVTNISIPKVNHLQVTQTTSNGKVYLSLFRKVNKRLRLIKLTLIEKDAAEKVLVNNIKPKTDFIREAILDFIFIDSVTDFRIVKKIVSHNGTKTYVHGRAISPTKFDDPKYWDAVYTVDNKTGKILSRLIDGHVVAEENNLRYFMGGVESISLTKAGFLEVIQGPSRLKNNNYSVVTYEDCGDYLKIIGIEVLNDDGSRTKSQ